MRAYRIAYDGRPYHGFQRQPDVPTVEGELLAALAALGVCERGTPPGYAAAGRTDAGVSARAQTVGFEAPEWLTPAALNAELPSGVRAWASARPPAGFHATHDAITRTYTYFLHAPEGSAGRARRALGVLAGEHDFHNFTPEETGTVRTLETDLVREGEFLVCTFRAGGFARQLVRRLVSVVADVARGGATTERVEALLGARTLDGPEGVGPAPAHPLVLTDVDYDLSFSVDERAAASARECFEKRRIEHATRARVADRLSPD